MKRALFLVVVVVAETNTSWLLSNVVKSNEVIVQEQLEPAVEKPAKPIDPIILNAVLVITGLWEILTIWAKKLWVFGSEQSVVWAKYAVRLWETRIKIFLIEVWHESVRVIKNSNIWKEMVQKLEGWMGRDKVQPQVVISSNRGQVPLEELEQPNNPAEAPSGETQVD